MVGTDDAATLAQALLQMATQPFSFDGRLYNVSLSIGIAMYPDHAEERIDLIACADQALYRAKKAGRDRVVVADAADRAVATAI